MTRCEDYPCCGHESGCCPDYDESGKQLNMKCVCGATVSLTSHSSCCSACLRNPEYDGPDGIFTDFGSDMIEDMEAEETAELDEDYDDFGPYTNYEGDY